MEGKRRWDRWFHMPSMPKPNTFEVFGDCVIEHEVYRSPCTIRPQQIEIFQYESLHDDGNFLY